MHQKSVVTGILASGMLCLLASSAYAARQPDGLRGHRPFELAGGEEARLQPLTVSDPGWTLPAWTRFRATEGGTWRTLWDQTTRVPMRIFGSGIRTPGAVSSAPLAAAYADEVLVRHIDLLAPGSDPADFVQVSNHLHDGIRTVGYRQYHDGLPVMGGQVSFRFKGGRLAVLASEALPWIDAATQGNLLSRSRAEASARTWIHAEISPTHRVLQVHGPYVLPILPAPRSRVGLHYETVLAVTVETRHPLGRWDVYVDAFTGAPVARRQLLRFAGGRVFYRAPVRYPEGGYDDFPASFATLDVRGSEFTSDASGFVPWTGEEAVQVGTAAVGPYARVTNDVGDGATVTLPLQNGGTATWDASDTELVNAQIAAFVHANRAKEFARGLDPTLAWLARPLSVTVNIDDQCNAYYDGNSINFMQSSHQCGNTGALSDVIYHEFGHALHAESIIAGVGGFDESLSEGLADMYSAVINEDPGMGRGFFKTSEPLRHIDPDNDEYVWPDDISQDSHGTGLIIGGALWDLRKELITEMGPEAGAAHLLRLYYAAMQRAPNIPAVYAEVLLADDDDGDLSNGTPHMCAIQRAFAPHGIAGDENMVGGYIVHSPVHERLDISVQVQDMGTSCSELSLVSAKLDWVLRDWPAISGTEDMTEDATRYAATIPSQDEEGLVVRYQVVLEFSDGTLKRFPRNQADPWYEVFIGNVFPIYCTDFEHDPESDGWTHGLTAGQQREGADDWSWGTTRSDIASGDPVEPYSGEKVFGNDLGGGTFNGKYQANIINFALSPVFDVTGYEMVRLQYRRWLQVEDAHFDKATIYANDVAVWDNFNSNSGDNSKVHHQDQEWRFHDVDLSQHVDANGQVQVRFEIDSDGGLEFGGWTIDDLCIVGWIPPRCGDGRVSAGEECDDGVDNSNTDVDACRTNCQEAFCGDGVLDSDEECDDGNVLDNDRCSSTCKIQDAPKSGCGCQTRPGTDAGALVLLAIALALLWRRRRG